MLFFPPVRLVLRRLAWPSGLRLSPVTLFRFAPAKSLLFATFMRPPMPHPLTVCPSTLRDLRADVATMVVLDPTVRSIFC